MSLHIPGRRSLLSACLITIFSLTIFSLTGLSRAAHAEDQARTLTTEEELGRQIYHQGASDREITAVLGEGGTEVPASMMPCASCHGTDGRGRPEGGLSPSDITWSALTRPWGGERSSGRRHPPYNERMLKRAFTMGLDPAGNRLHMAMPRYRLTLEEAAGLTSYIKRLGQVPDPGVEDNVVRLGVLHSTDAVGQAMRRVLEAAAAELATAGGVYSRRPELRFLALPAAPEERRDAVAQFLESEDIFALVASDLSHPNTLDDAGIRDLLLFARVPLVGAFGIDPPDITPPNPFVFYLDAGPQQLARALVNFAAGPLRSPPQRAVVISPPEAAAEAAALRRQGRHLGGPWADMAEITTTEAQPFTSEQALAEQGAGTDAVFFLGPATHAATFLNTADAIGWSPNVFLLGPRAGALLEHQPALADRTFLAFPNRPTDTSPKGFARYQKLAAQHHLNREHIRQQLRALAAFDLLKAGLENAGRELDRGRLVAALEALDRHPTNLTPPLSFGPNRRVGALGAWIVPLATGRQGLGGDGTWITLTPL